jgi:surface antigen
MVRSSVGTAYDETRILGFRAVATLILAASLGAPLGACSFEISSLLEPAETTGSIVPTFKSPLSSDLGPEDWRRAKAALGVALDPQGNGSSASWENSETGLKGTFVPVGAPFVQSDEVCRAFVATITKSAETSSSLQGTACRRSPDEWGIHGVKPWRKPA